VPEAKLVGSQVDEVVSRLKDAASARQFRTFSLIAPSGTGKSRIVRELYERYRAAQQPPGYWPLLTDRSNDPLANRKVLGPQHDEISAPQGAAPDFFWVSIICGQRADGDAVRALHQVSTQLDLHAEPTLVALAQSSTMRARLSKYGSGVVDDLREETFSAAFGNAVETALGTSIPMSGAVLSQLRRLTERALRLHSARQAVAAGYLAERLEESDLARRLARDLAEIAAVLPTVIVIEDAHLLDASTARLVTILRDLAAPVLVVGTVWPEGMDRERYASLMTEMTRTGSHTDIELDPWTPSDLMEVVRLSHPQTDDTVLSAIAERFRTPLTIELFLSLRSVSSRSVDGRLDVSPAFVATATNDDKGLYQERWAELDPEVQEALVLAMAATGAPPFGDGSAFIREAVAEVGRVVASADGIGAGLAAAANRDNWTAELEGGIDAYREPLLSDLVVSKLGHWYQPDQLVEFGRAALDWLARRLVDVDLADRIRAEDNLAARWFIALDASLGGGEATVLARARLIYGSALMDLADFVAAVEVLEPPFVAATEMLEVRRRSRLFEALSGAGQPKKAVAVGLPLVEELRASRPGCDADLTTLRAQLGYWQRNVGDYVPSLQTYGDLIEDLERCGDPHDVELLTARAGRASALGLQGDADRAERQFDDLGLAAARLLGASHPMTLTLERSRWRWAGAAGRPHAASDGLARVHESMVASVEMGPRHTETMFALSQLAYFVLACGDTSRAIELYEEVVELRRSVLGTAHPHMVDSMRNLARARTTHDPAAAIALSEALLVQVEGALGPGHPLTLSTRFDLLCLLAERGHAARASEEVQVLQGQVQGQEPGFVMRTFGEYGMTRAMRLRLQTLITQLRGPESPEAASVVEGWLRDLAPSRLT